MSLFFFLAFLLFAFTFCPLNSYARSLFLRGQIIFSFFFSRRPDGWVSIFFRTPFLEAHRISHFQFPSIHNLLYNNIKIPRPHFGLCDCFHFHSIARSFSHLVPRRSNNLPVAFPLGRAGIHACSRFFLST